MKKQFLLTLACLLSASLWAADVSLTENFSTIGNVATGNYTWTGDLCTWNAILTARRKQDTIHTAEQKQAIWMPINNTGSGKVSTVNWEGGIKAVSFKYARYGSENTSGRVLQLKVTAGDIENSTPTFAKNAMKIGNGVSASHETYSYAFNNKTNAQLSVENISTVTEDLTSTGICRIMVGDIQITPYLLYTTKEVRLDNRFSGTFTNTNLINNTEGEVNYISSNTAVATINETTGEVTLVAPGITIITASWEGVTTTYTLYYEDVIT